MKKKKTNWAGILGIIILLGIVVVLNIPKPAVGVPSITYPIQGGTGISTVPSAGSLLIGDGTNSIYNVATLTAGTNITITNADGSITVASTGGGANTVSTSTSETAGNLAYWTTTSGSPALLGEVATTTITAGVGLSFDGTQGFLVGGSDVTLNAEVQSSDLHVPITVSDTDTIDLTLSIQALSADSLLTFDDGLTLITASVDCDIADTSTFGCLTNTDWNTFNNKQNTLTLTYPLVLTGATGSIAFGTTTTNTWANLQTFTSGINVNSVDITNFEGTGLSITTGTLNAEVQTSDLHNAVTLTGTPDYITIDGNQVITRGLIVLTTDVTGLLPASEVSIALGSGSPTVDQLQEYLDNTGSSGFFLDGAISDGGSGTVNVAAGSGFIRTTNDDNAELQSFKWSASSGIAVTNDTTQYIYVDDSGTISLSSNEFLERPDLIKIGVVTDEAGAIESTFNLGVRLQESVAEAGRFIRRVLGISRDVRRGGLIFGQSGDVNRDVTMTTGALWWGRTEYPISAFNTSGIDTFDSYVAGAKEQTATSSWDNLNYDNGGSLTEMANNRWANLFFYVEPDDHIAMVYGRAQFQTQAGAEMEEVPSSSLPSRISNTSVLAARFTFQKLADTATIVSAFDTVFSAAGVTDHSNLAGLAWTSANHTGTVLTFAGFDGSGDATEYTEANYLLVAGTRALTGDWNVGAFDITVVDLSATNIVISGDTINDFAGTGLVVTGSALTLDLNELGIETTIVSGDFIPMVDITDSGSQKITLANFATSIDGVLNLSNIGGTLSAGQYGAATIDGDDINSNIAGNFLTLTSASPDTLDVDTGAIADGATTVLATSDAIYDFVRTATSTMIGTSNIVIVGALDSGSITANFGNIDNGASTIDTTGAVSFGNTVVNSGATLTLTDLGVASGAFLAVNASGVVIATTSPTGGGGASQLDELSDVVSATNTNRFILIANGTTGYVGRTLEAADVPTLNQNTTGQAGTVVGFTPAGGSLTLAGADALTITTGGVTNITLPTGSNTLAANNQTFFIGTTQVAINRASATLNLAGIGTLGVGAITGTTATFASASSLTLGTASSAAGAIIYQNGTNANTVTIQSGVTSASYTLTLPLAVAGAGEVLTDAAGNGVLSWAAGGGGGSGTVDNGTANQVAFYASNGTTVSGTSTLTILNERVGINVASPAGPLHIVADSGNEIVRFEENSGGEDWTIELDSLGDFNFRNDGTTSVFSFKDSTNQVLFRTSGSESAPVITFSDSNTGIWVETSDSLSLGAGAVEFITLVEIAGQDELVFNQDGDDIDFRVETVGQANALFIDGATGSMSLGTTTAGTLFVNGSGLIYSGAGGGGVDTLAAIGSTPNANAATIAGTTLNLQPASASFGGVVTTGTQTFAGNKTFSGNTLVSGINNFGVGSFSDGTGQRFLAGIEVSSDAAYTLKSQISVSSVVVGAKTNNLSGSTNRSYANFLVTGQTEVASNSVGNHALMANVAIKPLIINSSTHTISDAATLYIEGAATGTASPSNNYALWVDDGLVQIDDALTVDGALTATGIIIFSDGSLELPNGANPTVTTTGRIALDTTDNQLLVADSGGTARVIQTEVRIWGVTVASTSPAFLGNSLLSIPTQLDGYTITRIQCHVVGGTSKVIAVEDGSANSSEDITCATSNTTDDGSITNATYTASELSNIDFGAVVGVVDTVSISVFGLWLRE